VILAGLVLKVGAYGLLRFAVPLFPGAAAALSPYIMALAVVGILYGALLAFGQSDLKRLVAYTSVSHMGFVLLGLLTLNSIGMSGAVLQMFSHGVIAGLLFAVVGRMVYDRAHTRDLAALQGMNLSARIPFAAVAFTIASVASMGLPGFSGFVSELQVLIGAWQAFPTLAVVAGLGILIGVAYSMRALQKAFFRNAEQTPTSGVPTDGNVQAPLEPISIPERLGAVLLIGISILIGLYPRLLLDLISQSFGLPLFDGLTKGGAP
jgi:NADH-quinone oxidoreductase subunit M